MKTPNVIVPPDCNAKAEVREHGEHLGICECPACHTDYWSVGKIIRCECGFEFPTNAWSNYSSGVQYAWGLLAGSSAKGTHWTYMTCHYYRYGFNNPPPMRKDGESFSLYNIFRLIDWKQAVANQVSTFITIHMCTGLCERCGMKKTGSRENSSKLCVRCEHEAVCVHRVSMMEKTCKAGVELSQFSQHAPPCYFCTHGKPASCDKFERKPIKKILADDEATEKRMAAYALVNSSPEILEFRRANKGKSNQTKIQCPACLTGVLHLSISGHNGHVHGHCSSKNCLSWME